MHPPTFKTRFASVRNLDWSNQWAADDAVSKSTEPSGTGSSSADPSLVAWQKGHWSFSKFYICFLSCIFFLSLFLKFLFAVVAAAQQQEKMDIEMMVEMRNYVTKLDLFCSHKSILMLFLQHRWITGQWMISVRSNIDIDLNDLSAACVYSNHFHAYKGIEHSYLYVMLGYPGTALACSSWLSLTSIPTTSWKCGANTRDSWPVPHPRSTARTCGCPFWGFGK